MNVIEKFKQSGKIRYLSYNDPEAVRNRRRKQILNEQGYKIKVDGSWGSWLQKIWDNYIKENPQATKRVDLSKVTTKENRDRSIPVEALEQFQDSLIGRYYSYPHRLALLATSLQEVDENGAASKGVGGNGYLGLSESRMPIEYLDDSPEGRGKQIQYILDDLEEIKGPPNNNWTAGNNQAPTIMSAQEGFDKFWSATDPYQATLYLNKSYIRPAGEQQAWINRAKIAKLLENK